MSSLRMGLSAFDWIARSQCLKEIESMEFEDFERVVLDEADDLFQRGYKLVENQELPFHIHLSRDLTPEIQSLIEFQMLENFVDPVREFNIGLYRIGNTNSTMDTSTWKRLSATLANLMQFGFKIRIFPDDKFFWEFRDEAELRNELQHALTYLIDYGLRWLEDPLSSESWRSESNSS